MLNPNLDFAPYARRLAETGRVQVRDFLDGASAAALRDCLLQDVPWSLALRRDGASRTLAHAEYAALSPAARQQELEAAYAEARAGRYQFAYDSYMMVTAYLEGRDPGLLLHRVLEFLNAPPFIGWARQFTGDPRIRRTSAQATCFRPGQFLNRHNDFDAEEGRLYAYVINLSPHWQPDWGGLLHFLDEHGEVVESLQPHYNSLSLFKVPQMHFVSQVAPYATTARQAITGWMQS